MMTPTARDIHFRIATIAHDALRVAHLASRSSDAADFHTVACWEIEKALLAAFAAGAEFGSKHQHSHGSLIRSAIDQKARGK